MFGFESLVYYGTFMATNLEYVNMWHFFQNMCTKIIFLLIKLCRTHSKMNEWINDYI